MDKRVEKRPKLLVTTTTLPRWKGDSEPRFVLDLAIAMQADFDITILAPMSPGAAARETLDGIKIERYRYAPLRRWETLTAPGAILPNIRRAPLLLLAAPLLFCAQLLALKRLLRQERFDIVHGHWLIPQGLAYAVMSCFSPCPPVLLTCHGGDAFALNSAPFRRMKKMAIGRANALTGVSTEILDYLQGLIGSGSSIEIRHIPMGVDLDKFGARRRGSLPEKGRRILFVGRIAEKKGLPVLVDAMRNPLLLDIGATLTVIGDGPLRAAVEREAANLVEAGRLVFAGALPHDAIAAAFQEADVFCAPFVVAPDGDREGTPTVILEAAASGAPIVASDIGGCRDLIIPGVSGWLVSPGDSSELAQALAEALLSPDAARERAKAAREAVAQYAWPSIGRRYSQLIQSIIRQGACESNDRSL